MTRKTELLSNEAFNAARKIPRQKRKIAPSVKLDAARRLVDSARLALLEERTRRQAAELECARLREAIDRHANETRMRYGPAERTWRMVREMLADGVLIERLTKIKNAVLIPTLDVDEFSRDKDDDY